MITGRRILAAAFGTAAALSLAAQPASAQGMGGMGHGPMAMSGGMGMHGGSPFMMLLKSANLTPEQRSQVELIVRSNKTQMMAMHQQLQTLHEKISDKILGAGAVTSADLKPLVDQASRVEAKLNQNMADTAIAIRNVLTAEQVKHLAEVHSKLHALHTQVQSLMGNGMQGDQDN
ncbi:MAG TPA: periplasmic heavy metal sensor [Rhizomicrobium sp.]|jgi:Spy/CpxP family protein refolding chaperone|nr:periplasmic heavy metal sensor [Rhizomicrobium sp.]